MTTSSIISNAAARTIVVERYFAAPRHAVWLAWTTPAILDQWWAPQPWRAVTKDFSFVPGGHWLYRMVGPSGEKVWSLMNYKDIVPESHFTAKDAFCDENGVINPVMPECNWRVEFHDSLDGTRLTVTVTLPTESAMTKLIDMGFEQGFAMGLENLERALLN